jgi:hypothetical protein
MTDGADLDKAFVPMSFQIAKDKRMFSDEEINSNDPKWYWKKIDDPEYLKRSEYELNKEDTTSFTVSLLTRQVELLTRKLDYALNRITVLETLLDVVSESFNEDDETVEDVEQPHAPKQTDGGLLTSVVNTVTNAVQNVFNIVTGSTKEVVETKPAVEEVVTVSQLPTYLKFSYTDSIVMNLLNSSTNVREKYTLETIRDKNGYGKMGYFKKYEGNEPPTQEELTLMEDKLEKLRLEGLNGLCQPALDFATFDAKCNSLISAEYQRDPRYKRTRDYAATNYTTLDYNTLRDQSDSSTGYPKPVEPTVSNVDVVIAEAAEELLSASTPTTDLLDPKFKTD